MGTVNRVILVGNLGRDAELRYTGTGTPVAKFSVATTETYKGRDGEKKEETEWHRINLWGKSAETLAQYLTKGKQVYIEGRLKTQKWKDKEGADRTTVEVTADKVTLLGGGSRSQAAGREETGHEAGAGSDVAVSMPGDDEVPF
jgi:single-strand DNA-binding protein